MRTPIAWLNLLQTPKRTLTAISGICFAVLLIFMQAGFLGAARLNASQTYRMLDCDLLIVSRGYLMLTRAESIDRFRVIQARSIEGVASATPLTIESANWFRAGDHDRSSCFLYGVNSTSTPFLDPALNTQLSPLREPETMLVDLASRPSFGPWQEQGVGNVNGVKLNVKGTYTMGAGLLADGSIIVGEGTLARLLGRDRLDQVSFGLIRVAPGYDPAVVAEALRAALPKDVRIETRQTMIERDEHYFVQVKPVGIMFQVGMLVAFIVGAVILYQILSSEITKRLKEYATLKAMGASRIFIYSIGVQQGLLFSFFAYVPSFLLALVLYRVLRALSGFPVYMDAGRAFGVLGLSLAMCAIAAVLALGKIRRADPADLF